MTEPALVVDVGGFEGPLDLLLSLARQQKVDLREISILALAEQYLAFVERAARARIDLAADYLVMAAWLAYLKSRLLLPPEPGEEEDREDAEAMARDLAWRLARLEALRGAAGRLMARPRLGVDVFARGEAEAVPDRRAVRLTATLHDLLAAYARVRTRDDFRPFALDRVDVYTMEEALDRLRPLIGGAGEWSDLTAWLPPDWRTGARRRAATAATFAAALELVREGLAEIRQDAAFGPIALRARRP